MSSDAATKDVQTMLSVRRSVHEARGPSQCQDETTVFGSEFELASANQTRSQTRASRAVMRRQEESTSASVPEEVTILCQEIVEV